MTRTKDSFSRAGVSLWQTHGLPWGAALGFLAFGRVWPQAAVDVSPWLFLSSALLLGMPHGALDPWIPQWVERRRFSATRWFALLAVYVAVVAAAGFLVWQNRVIAVAALLLLTAWHWGTGDAAGLPVRRTSLVWALSGLARGAILVSAPFFFQRASAVAFLTEAAFPPGAPTPWFWVEAGQRLPDIVFPVALILETLILVGIFSAAEPASPSTRGDGRRLTVVAHFAETVLYVALCAWLPPEFAVGVYFIFFHSWRHLLRLAWLRTGTGSAKAIGGLLVQGWFFSVGGLLLLGLTASVLAGGRPWLEAARSTYPLVLFALTMPHAALVFWIDTREARAVGLPSVMGAPASGCLPRRSGGLRGV